MHLINENPMDSTIFFVRKSSAADLGWKIIDDVMVFKHKVLACPKCVKRYLKEKKERCGNGARNK